MNDSVADTQFVFDRMSGISRFIYETFATTTSTGEMDYKMAGFILLAVVFLMSALVFKLGFARKLKLVQTILIYTFLFLGCLILTFLAFFLPIVEGLIVAALILIIYRVRRMFEYKGDDKKDSIA
ncbi:YlaH-like family protein [Sporosarcina sp. G11-34]|uniref:YlaH-like family protein n=1 Tax=Sporosarcina sp. G11-34 TaxID=2849605 RepID=UPI0022A90CDD|nr:YlaH-like family protein [Sporosarcina sp. G11-34]MCZ2257153.1 YlaH-like family protein [Sporosarcina sp. G11-34]